MSTDVLLARSARHDQSPRTSFCLWLLACSRVLSGPAARIRMAGVCLTDPLLFIPDYLSQTSSSLFVAGIHVCSDGPWCCTVRCRAIFHRTSAFMSHRSLFVRIGIVQLLKVIESENVQTNLRQVRMLDWPFRVMAVRFAWGWFAGGITFFTNSRSI